MPLLNSLLHFVGVKYFFSVEDDNDEVEVEFAFNIDILLLNKIFL